MVDTIHFQMVKLRSEETYMAHFLRLQDSKR
nr:MAG TPA: hypothetical protein [Crassvirales sp.]